MPKRKPPTPDVNLAEYFVPAPRKKTAPESPSNETVAGAKYFVRRFPLPRELPEKWDGTGPDLPEGYEGGEACPDCSAMRFSTHAPLCIRNPNQQTFDLRYAWDALHTKEQIFFGAGHPILRDVDEYMTIEKQKRLTRLAVVVMYDIPDGSSFRVLDEAHFEKRQVIVSWRERQAENQRGDFDV